MSSPRGLSWAMGILGNPESFALSLVTEPHFSCNFTGELPALHSQSLPFKRGWLQGGPVCRWQRRLGSSFLDCEVVQPPLGQPLLRGMRGKEHSACSLGWK